MKQFAKLLLLASTLVLSACASPYAIERGAYGDYIAGQHAKFERDTDKAAEYFESALSRDPNNEFVLQEAFSLAIMDGHFNKALSLANDLEDIGAENSTAAILLSLNAFKRGRLDEVELHLEKAKGTGFDSLLAPIIRAWVQVQLGQLEASIAALEALKEIPLFEPYQLDHAALLYDYADRFVAAEDAYMNILTSSNSVSIHPVLFFGNMLVRTGQIGRANELYDRFELLWEDNRRLQLAVENMNAIRPRNAKRPDPVEALGYALLRAASEIARDNTHAPAILYARLSTFMDPKRDDTILLLSNLFMAQHQPEAALRSLENVDSNSLFADLARVKEAYAYNEMGEVEKAVSLLENYLRNKPADVSVRTSLGDIYQVHERYLEARAHYNIAIDSIDEFSLENWYLVFSRGISNERLGNWDEAEADFMKALSLKPNEPQVLNYLGYSWVDRGERFVEARRMIERAVAQRPNDGAIIDSLGWVLYLLGEYDGAVEKLERAIELTPNDPLINDHLGDAYWMVGRKIEARFQWRQALTLKPEADIIKNLEAKIRLGLTIVQALESSVDAAHDE